MVLSLVDSLKENFQDTGKAVISRVAIVSSTIHSRIMRLLHGGAEVPKGVDVYLADETFPCFPTGCA